MIKRFFDKDVPGTAGGAQGNNAVAARVAAVRGRIEAAAAKAGRNAEEITLVGVTKTRTAEEVRQLIAAGVTDIGENRVQELLDKAPHLEDLPHTTHLIGHLQRNKAKYLPGKIDMLQSLDGESTLHALEKAWLAGEEGERLDVLIEVNIGGEESKSGVPEAGLLHLAEAVCQSPAMRLRGLMAIPPILPGEEVRPYFERMHHLFVDIKSKKMDNSTVDILSMGMSQDFEWAILEGATMVRVGTGLFGPRQYT